MLALEQVGSDERIVYACPDSKTAYVCVDVFASVNTSCDVVIKLGKDSMELVYWTGSVSFISFKFILNAGDYIKVSSSDVVNVFVYGKEI